MQPWSTGYKDKAMLDKEVERAGKGFFLWFHRRQKDVARLDLMPSVQSMLMLTGNAGGFTAISRQS